MINACNIALPFSSDNLSLIYFFLSQYLYLQNSASFLFGHEIASFNMDFDLLCRFVVTKKISSYRSFISRGFHDNRRRSCIERMACGDTRTIVCGNCLILFSRKARSFDVDVMQNRLPSRDMCWHWLRKTNHSINYVKIVLIDWMFFSIEVEELRSTCSDQRIIL